MLITTTPYGAIITVSATAHPAWRVFIDSITTSTSFMTLREVEFKDSGGTVFNGGTPFTSSGTTEANAFDGNTSTTWDTLVADNEDQHIGMMFANPVELASVRLVGLTGAPAARDPQEWRIQYSDDTTDGTDGTWEDADSHSNINNVDVNWSVVGEIETTIPNPNLGEWNILQSSASDVGDLALSNSNLTVTQTSGGNGHRRIKNNIGHHRGKWYAEIFSSNGNTIVGMPLAHLPASGFPGPGGKTITTSGTVGIEYDGDAKIARFNVNGTLVSTQSGLLDEAYYLGCSIFNAGKNCTLNTGGSAFAFPIPAGYTSWDGLQSA